MSFPEAATYTLIRDLPATDRPRERLRDAGAQALSNPELLAILLRVGSAKESALSQAGTACWKACRDWRRPRWCGRCRRR